MTARICYLCAAMACAALGQAPGNRYETLQQVLHLSDSQMRQIQESVAVRDRILNDAQRSKLVAIATVLDRDDIASETMAMGLIGAAQWPGGNLCHYPVRTYAAEFGLSEAQVQQFERLLQAVQEPLFRRIREASWPANAQFVAEMPKLQRQLADIRPPRELTLSLLDDSQKEMLREFEANLQLAGEAIALGLIPRPVTGEFLCH